MNILAIDQGTTSSRAFIFNEQFSLLATAQHFFNQSFPRSGWVEHDPEEIWQSVLECCRQAVSKANLSFKYITTIGITNQRETTIVWDRQTGKVLYPAIVWQDRRTSDFCHELKQKQHESLIQNKTGLLIDPYFSASKIRWILQNTENGLTRAQNGELAFGTIDCFLLWRLTGGKVHAMDATNASRTSLFNIHSLQWDDELLSLFSVPKSMLPEVKNNADDFGVTDPALFGSEIPINAMVGDQQSALVGQACLEPGMVKSTYGTGCFVIWHTGDEVVTSDNRLLSTIGYRNTQTKYALEGSIFSAGVIVKWLRDKMRLIAHANDTETMAQSVTDNDGVYLVPAFTGLGAPYWNPDVRAAIVGLSRGTESAHIVRAGLEAIAYQTKDLFQAMAKDGAVPPSEIRVDGAMVQNSWFLQFLADVLDVPVVRPKMIETTVLGAAFLAALRVSKLQMSDLTHHWQQESRFEPAMADSHRDRLYSGWQAAIQHILVEV